MLSDRNSYWKWQIRFGTCTIFWCANWFWLQMTSYLCNANYLSRMHHFDPFLFVLKNTIQILILRLRIARDMTNRTISDMPLLEISSIRGKFVRNLCAQRKDRFRWSMIWMARNLETDRHIPNRSRRRYCAIYRSSFVDDFGHWICLEQSSRRSGQSCVRVDGLFHFGGRRMERVGSVWRHVYVCQQNGSQNSVMLESDHLPENFNFLASIQLKTVSCLITFFIANIKM